MVIPSWRRAALAAAVLPGPKLRRRPHRKEKRDMGNEGHLEQARETQLAATLLCFFFLHSSGESSVSLDVQRLQNFPPAPLTRPFFSQPHVAIKVQQLRPKLRGRSMGISVPAVHPHPSRRYRLDLTLYTPQRSAPVPSGGGSGLYLARPQIETRCIAACSG